MAPLCRLDGIDIADNIGNGDVRGGKLFDVTFLARPIGDRSLVSAMVDKIPAAAANRTERIVVDLTAFDDRNNLIQKICQAAKNPALGLSTQPEKNHIVPGEYCVDD